MTRGFYTLGSGLITQNQSMSAINNNVANVKTPGFKKDMVVSSTFGEMVMNRIDPSKTPLGSVSMLKAADITHTIHSQGIIEPSERNLDFAIVGPGFFAVQGEDETVYSRNGSFNIDNEGYLTLLGVGRIMGENGPIQIETDNIVADQDGNIYGADGEIIDTIALYDFENYEELLTVGAGMYNGPDPTLVEQPLMQWQAVEMSNVDVGQEMTNSIAAQRVLQNVSQALKMYDKTMESATTQIGRI